MQKSIYALYERKFDVASPAAARRICTGETLAVVKTILKYRAPERRASEIGAQRPSVERVRALEAERQSIVSLLNILRTGQPAARLDLERETNLGRAVVSDRLNTLASFGLVQESGTGRSIGGRAPRLVKFCPEAARILVANVDGDTIGVGVADLQGRLIQEHYEDIEPTITAGQLSERLETMLDWSLGDRSTPLWGIGIGLPGTVEQIPGDHSGVPRLGAMPAWNETRLLERLKERFQVPIWVRGAVQMETMGELAALQFHQRQNLLYVDLGMDISAGIVMGGHLYQGAHGIPGQIGHIYTGQTNTRICGCGNAGCLRTVAGCGALVEAASSAAEQGQSALLGSMLARNGRLRVADIGAAARFGDPYSAELLAEAGRMIGTVLAAIVNVLNPSMIIVGGELAQTGDICLAAIREGVYRHALALVSRDISIVRSHMGRSSGLVGAAAVVLTELFAPAFLKEWILSGTPTAHPFFVKLATAGA